MSRADQYLLTFEDVIRSNRNLGIHISFLDKMLITIEAEIETKLLSNGFFANNDLNSQLSNQHIDRIIEFLNSSNNSQLIEIYRKWLKIEERENNDAQLEQANSTLLENIEVANRWADPRALTAALTSDFVQVLNLVFEAVHHSASIPTPVAAALGMPIALGTLVVGGLTEAYRAADDPNAAARNVTITEGLTRTMLATRALSLLLGHTLIAGLSPFSLPVLFAGIITGMIIKQDQLIKAKDAEIAVLDAEIQKDQTALNERIHTLSEDKNQDSAKNPSDVSNHNPTTSSKPAIDCDPTVQRLRMQIAANKRKREILKAEREIHVQARNSLIIGGGPCVIFLITAATVTVVLGTGVVPALIAASLTLFAVCIFLGINRYNADCSKKANKKIKELKTTPIQVNDPQDDSKAAALQDNSKTASSTQDESKVAPSLQGDSKAAQQPSGLVVPQVKNTPYARFLSDNRSDFRQQLEEKQHQRTLRVG